MENTVKVAALISFITSVSARALDEHEVSTILKLMVELKADHVVVNRLLMAMQGERKIEAIKEYRTLTGSGLLESKNAIEAYWPHGRTNIDAA